MEFVYIDGRIFKIVTTYVGNKSYGRRWHAKLGGISISGPSEEIFTTEGSALQAGYEYVVRYLKQHSESIPL